MNLRELQFLWIYLNAISSTSAVLKNQKIRYFFYPDVFDAIAEK